MYNGKESPLGVFRDVLVNSVSHELFFVVFPPCLLAGVLTLVLVMRLIGHHGKQREQKGREDSLFDLSDEEIEKLITRYWLDELDSRDERILAQRLLRTSEFAQQVFDSMSSLAASYDERSPIPGDWMDKPPPDSAA